MSIVEMAVCPKCQSQQIYLVQTYREYCTIQKERDDLGRLITCEVVESEHVNIFQDRVECEDCGYSCNALEFDK